MNEAVDRFISTEPRLQFDPPISPLSLGTLLYLSIHFLMTDSNKKAKTMTDVQLSLAKAVAAINAPSGNLYDVTSVCTTDDHQAQYWMDKLSAGVCKKVPVDGGGATGEFPMVLAVSEDWEAGGAGNGLGTLYAYTKAAKLAKEKFNVDLDELLAQKKISAALFHTAGKGTRLAPLPASENNNKPGVVRNIFSSVLVLVYFYYCTVFFIHHRFAALGCINQCHTYIHIYITVDSVFHLQTKLRMAATNH